MHTYVHNTKYKFQKRNKQKLTEGSVNVLRDPYEPVLLNAIMVAMTSHLNYQIFSKLLIGELNNPKKVCTDQ